MRKYIGDVTTESIWKFFNKAKYHEMAFVVIESSILIDKFQTIDIIQSHQSTERNFNLKIILIF